MPAGASLLKSEFAAAEKNVVVNITLHSHLAITLKLSFNSHYIIVDIADVHITNTLGVHGE